MELHRNGSSSSNFHNIKIPIALVLRGLMLSVQICPVTGWLKTPYSLDTINTLNAIYKVPQALDSHTFPALSLVSLFSLLELQGFALDGPTSIPFINCF